MTNYKYIECGTDWLRDVIAGKIQFRKCPSCDNAGIGYQAWDENGETCSAEAETAERYSCEKCQGIAYLELPKSGR